MQMSPPARRLFLTAVLAAAGVQPARADVILHAFDWTYADVARAAPQIAAAGYKAVLVAPPLKTERSPECPWYKLYQPQDFRVIDGCLGNKEDFLRMIAALTGSGVRVYADVVVNHMANERSNATVFPGPQALAAYRTSPSWPKQRLYGNLAVGLFSPRDFHSEICIRDYGDRDQVVRGRICGASADRGLPDLDDDTPGRTWVTDQRRQYVQALFDLGVRGFRIDAAKHMPLDAIRAFVPDRVADESHVFAEIITWGGTSDNEFNLYLRPYLERLPASFGAYDFPLLNAIKRAFSPGASLGECLANPYSRGDALEWNRAVTVVVTHDIPYNDGFRSLILDRKDEELAYAYILGRDGGAPLVFDDGTSWRSDNGRWVDAWKGARLQGMIAFHNRMQGRRMEVLHADACALMWRRDEDGIAGINKCGHDVSVALDTRGKLKWHVPYRDTLAGGVLTITGESHRFDLPARDARMWYAE
jgi:alpha-amylase